MILITIGRNPNNKMVINHQSVSGYHAEVKVRDDGAIFITDKGSTNGTTIKGQRIKSEVEVSVNRGDKIIFAGVVDLDWNKIPVITPPAIGWKLYSIGSDLNNRIQITDTAGSISRFHATLKIDPKNKMFINDHSSNGTFVNGSRIPANQDYPVKRKDKIMFANTRSLDWSRVKEKDPINLFYILSSIAAVLIICLIILSWQKGWINISHKMSDEEIFTKYSNSVVLVYHEYAIVGERADGKIVPLTNNHTITGTAFFIDKRGTLLTNRHVIMPWEEHMKDTIDLIRYRYILSGRGQNIAFSDLFRNIHGETIRIGIALNNTDVNNWNDFIDCAILSKSTDKVEKDIGFLRTKKQSLPSSNIDAIEINNPSLKYTKEDNLKNYANGKKVYVLGYPLGIDLLARTNSGTTNTIQIKLKCQTGNINTIPDDFKFGVSAQMTHGASGSPVLDEKGRLIGIFNSGFDITQGLNYAILSKHAKQLYDEIQ